MEWRVEELRLMNEKVKTFIGKQRIFSDETTTSREEKINFVDSFQNGKLSYLLDVIEKFRKDAASLPKDSWGNVKTVSLKAWIKKNDTGYGKPIIDDWYHYGKYSLLSSERYIQNDNKGSWDIYNDFVDECFHRQLNKCLQMEQQYFQAHDEYCILKKKLQENSNKYPTTFGVHIVFCSNGTIYVSDDNREREITITELKELLSKYEQLDNLVEKLTQETHIVY